LKISLISLFTTVSLRCQLQHIRFEGLFSARLEGRAPLTIKNLPADKMSGLHLVET